MAHLSIDCAGESVELFSDRALYWPARATLVIADVHFGKAASFRAGGLPIPAGTTLRALDRLQTLISRVNPERLVLLGDLWHAKQGKTEATIGAFANWRESNRAIEVVLIEGNHDLRAGKLPDELGIAEVHELEDGCFLFRHHPEPATGKYVLCGHIHPCVRLIGKARQDAKLACFWLGKEVGILPAFGEFTGCAEVSPAGGDRVFVACGDSIMQVR